MVGRRRERSQNEKGEGAGSACKNAIVFFFPFFLGTPDELKTPDWSDLMNYLIHPSDWSATCYSRA